MEWAQALQAAAARTLELQVLAHDLVDLAALADQRDVRGSDASPPGHQLLPPMTAALVAAVTAAVFRRCRTSSIQSRKTWWWRGRESSACSVGRGDQPPVEPLSAICRPPLVNRWAVFHIDTDATSTGVPSRSTAHVPFQTDVWRAVSRAASSGSAAHRPSSRPRRLANTQTPSPMTAVAASFQLEARRTATTVPSRRIGASPFG